MPCKLQTTAGQLVPMRGLALVVAMLACTCVMGLGGRAQAQTAGGAVAPLAIPKPPDPFPSPARRRGPRPVAGQVVRQGALRTPFGTSAWPPQTVRGHGGLHRTPPPATRRRSLGW